MCHSASQTFTWIVTRLLVTNPGTQQSADGASVTLAIQARTTGGGMTPTFTALTALPPNLTLNSTTGIISGTLANNAHTTSPYTVSIRVTAGNYSATVTFCWMLGHRPNGNG